MEQLQLRIGESRETESLDFKSIYWSTGVDDPVVWKSELAKDVAALANARGGHLVVGAAEKDETLVKFIDSKLPEKWEGPFRQVVASWLRPEPVVATKLRSFDGGDTQQLVVEVEPSIDTVLVSNPGDGKRRICVPVRRGTQSIYAPPKKVVDMLGNPHRRLQLRFREILELQENDVLENLQLVSAERPERRKRKITHSNKWRVSETEEDFVLMVCSDDGEKLVLPYDRVESVHPLNGARSRWQIVYDGFIVPFDDESHGYGPYKSVIRF